jgi:hypothetical protein
VRLTKRFTAREQALGTIKEAFVYVQENKLESRLTALQKQILDKMLQHPTDPQALKEAGLVYLYALGLPTFAKKHFELGLCFNPNSWELQNWFKMAEKTEAAKKGSEPSASHGEIKEGAKELPKAAAVIRATGKLPSIIVRDSAPPENVAEEVTLTQELVGLSPEDLLTRSETHLA